MEKLSDFSWALWRTRLSQSCLNIYRLSVWWFHNSQRASKHCTTECVTQNVTYGLCHSHLYCWFPFNYSPIFSPYHSIPVFRDHDDKPPYKQTRSDENTTQYNTNRSEYNHKKINDGKYLSSAGNNRKRPHERRRNEKGALLQGNLIQCCGDECNPIIVHCLFKVKSLGDVCEVLRGILFVQ